MTELHAAALAVATDTFINSEDRGVSNIVAETIEAYLAALPKANEPERLLRATPADNPMRVRHVHSRADGSFAALYFAQKDLAFGLNALCGQTHAASKNAGWYTNPSTKLPLDRNVPEMLMLIVSEIAEGMEGYRKGLMDDHLPNRLMLEVELADAVIRIGDLCGYLELDLAGAVLDKMAYNAKREDHKLEVRAAGGKAF